MPKTLQTCILLVIFTINSPLELWADTISLTGGTLSVASSWTGTPDSGWNGGSNSDTNTHGPTFQAVAFSSNPLSIANLSVADINQNGRILAITTNINWTGTVMGPRDFTLDASFEEGFSLSSTAGWNSSLLINPAIPFTRLDLMSPNNPTIDLLTTSAGTLPAGNYQITGEASGAWSYDGLSFLHQSQLWLEFDKSAIPEPSAALLLSIGGLTVCRRRKTEVSLENRKV